MACFTCNGVNSLVSRVVCLPEAEPTRFETCRRHQKLNINLENCALRLFVLYNYIITYGKKTPFFVCFADRASQYIYLSN